MTSPGDFSCISDSMTRTAFEDMYAAITAANAWTDMAKEPSGQGFLFSRDDHIVRIHAALNDRLGHSGASMAMTMRSMQHLARVGWAAFIAPYGGVASQSPLQSSSVASRSAEEVAASDPE